MTEDSRDPLVPLAIRDKKERKGSQDHQAPLVRGVQLGPLAHLESVEAKAQKVYRAPKAPEDPRGNLVLRDRVVTQALQAHQARMDFQAHKALLASRDCKGLWGNLVCLDQEGYQACLGCQACQVLRAPQAHQAHQEQQYPWPCRMSQPQHLKPMVSLSHHLL